MKYKTVALGGTFDKFHKGHKSFLTFAFSIGEKVIIGLTSNKYTSKFKSESISSPFEDRKKILVNFLEENHMLARATIIPIDDIYGPTLSKIIINALVVTEESILGGEEINRKRKELGFSQLPIIVFPLIKQSDIVISSGNIRKGITDNEGIPYVDPTWLSRNYRMPDGLRLILHKPFGTLFKNSDSLHKFEHFQIATVGDITTSHFIQNGIKPVLSIIDFFVERKKRFSKIEELGFTGDEKITHIINPASTICKEIWQVLFEIVGKIEKNEQYIILVNGEEDLLVLPLILSLPLGFMIFYGQPNTGFVQVEVTIQQKENARDIVRLFKEI